ncbi:MAG: hypothetical protein ACOCVF_00130 [bacterium]
MNKVKLKKINPKINIEVIDSKTEELLFTITDRNWSNLGEIFNDHHFSMISGHELKGQVIPDEVTLIAVSEFKKQ